MKVSFFLNRDAVSADVRSDQTVLEFLREERGLTGTKEACNEGDCGACVIVIGEPEENRFRYRAVNSCLMPAPRLHGKHVVTVEGLAEGDQLHPIQQAMVDHHAIQCGYCTPGIVMALFGLFQQEATPTQAQIVEALDGSLCRCTGYASIMKAALSVSDFSRTVSNGDAGLRPAYFDSIEKRMRTVPALEPDRSLQPLYFTPDTLNDLFSILENDDGENGVVLLNGGTDIMVAVNTKGHKPSRIADISQIAEFERVTETVSDLKIGARTTLSDVLESPVVQRRFPALFSAVRQMCSTPVRNSATVAGNICTASPIADTIPALLIYNAEAVLVSKAGTRRLPLRDFFISYRKTALRKGEVLLAVELPYSDYLSSFEKTGKRKVQDIASVNSAIALRLAGNEIADIRLVCGGVAAVPFWADQTCRFLKGKRVSESVVREAAQILADEITPLDDLRGSAEFRRKLSANHLVKHFNRLIPTMFR